MLFGPYFLLKLLTLFLFIILISAANLINSRHVVYIFVSLEIIFTTIVMLLLTLSRLHDDLNGVVFGLFLLGLIACEAALGLILLISIQNSQLKFY